MSQIKQVYFFCYGCWDYNKHHSDDANYEYQNPKLGDFLNEALNHLKEFPDHAIQIQYEEYEEE